MRQHPSEGWFNCGGDQASLPLRLWRVIGGGGGGGGGGVSPRGGGDNFGLNGGRVVDGTDVLVFRLEIFLVVVADQPSDRALRVRGVVEPSGVERSLRRGCRSSLLLGSSKRPALHPAPNTQAASISHLLQHLSS